MKKFAVVLLALLAVGITVPAMAAYKSEYKLDIVPSITTAWGQGAQYFADLVRTRTDGRVNIKVYPNAQLTTGKQTNAFMMIRNGAIDFACQSSINWSPQVVELNLFAMPFEKGDPHPGGFQRVEAPRRWLQTVPRHLQSYGSQSHRHELVRYDDCPAAGRRRRPGEPNQHLLPRKSLRVQQVHARLALCNRSHIVLGEPWRLEVLH